MAKSNEFWSFTSQKPRYDYEVRLSGGLGINFDYLEFFAVHVNLSRRTFLHFAQIEMRGRKQSVPKVIREEVEGASAKLLSEVSSLKRSTLNH